MLAIQFQLDGTGIQIDPVQRVFLLGRGGVGLSWLSTSSRSVAAVAGDADDLAARWRPPPCRPPPAGGARRRG
jgi:hypothetical protein